MTRPADADDTVTRARDLARAIEDVCALHEKYRALEALAREPRATRPGPYAAERKRRKRSLANRFPGALRELDRFSADDLGARAAALERYLEELLAAARNAAWPEPDRASRWVRWIIEFHEVTRALLKLKRSGVPAAFLHPHIPRAVLDQIHSPPRGRLLDLVYRVLSERHGVPEHEIRAALFPPEDPC